MERLRAENLPRIPEVVVDAVNLDETFRSSFRDVDIYVRLDRGKLAYVA
jgi:hypothetical protein